MHRRHATGFVVLSILFLFAFASVASAAPSASFGGPSQLGTGYYAYSQAAGDLNNDGHPDLVVPMYQSGSNGFVRTYLNNGSGGFTPSAVTTIAGSEAQLADLDRDGNLDMVAFTMWSSTGYNLTFAKGDGAGGMSFAGAYDSGWFTSYYDLGDFNGDTIPDLLVGTGDGDNVYIYTGNGDFTFTQSSVVTGIGYNSWTSDVGDINRDGTQDFVVANYGSASIDIRLGDGTGIGFLPIPDLPVGSNPTEVKLADLNRDGIPDLVVGYASSNRLSIFDGDGFGNFTNRHDITVTGVAVNDFKFADVNVDGTPDIVAGGVIYGSDSWSESKVRVLLNDGAGRFPVQVAPSLPQYWAYGLQSLSVADLDGDARPDILTSSLNSSWSNNIGWFMNTSVIDHTLDLDVSSADTNSIWNPRRLATGDLDRDGKLDLVAASFNEGMVARLMGDGLGGLNGTGGYGGLDSMLYGLSVADMNRDAILDVVTFDDSQMSLFAGDGSGGFSLQSQQETTGMPSGEVIDMNRDGSKDAVMTSWDATHSALVEGAGDGTFTAAGTLDLGTMNSETVVADFNGDGIEDILAVPDDRARLALGDGVGGFTTSVSAPITVYAASSLAVGDLNGDTRPDLAISTSSGIQIVFNDGTGPSIVGPWLDGSGRDVALADFNVDGSMDVASCGDDRIARFFVNDGSGAFTLDTSVDVGSKLFGLAAGDFDRDGRPDLACAGESGKIYMLTNDVTAPYTTAVFDFAPDGNLDWYVSTPTVTLETNEPATTDYTFNGSGWGAYSGGALAPIVQGTNTVSYYSVDDNLLKESTQTTTFKIDTIDPVTTIDGLPAGISSTDVTFTLSASDPGAEASGLGTTYYQFDAGTPQVYSTTATLTAEGSTVVSWWSVDVAGNIETHNTQTVEIDKPNPPVTSPDEYALSEDGTLTVLAPGVLGNDTDPEATGLSASVDTSPAHGTLSLSADGGFVYEPDANWSGVDTFKYSASNGPLSSTVDTVTITVNEVPDAPTSLALSANHIAENMPEDTGIGGLSATDIDSASLTYSILPGLDGSLFKIVGDELLSAATFDFETDSAYSLNVRVEDGDGLYADAVFDITVEDGNDVPIAVADSYETTEGITLVAAPPGVLDNDTDQDVPHSLTTNLLSGPTHGALTLNTDGSFEFTPDAYMGDVTFTYQAFDGTAYSEIQTVTVTVNPLDGTAPTTTSDALATYEGEALITLDATDDVSGVAATYWKLDGGATQTGTSIEVVTTGDHTLEFWSEDVAGNVETTNTAEFSITSDIIPIEGADRYGTAIRTSQVAFPKGADEAVICRGDLWADVSGGSALAGAIDGPLLLTLPGELADGLIAELERLGVTHVYILGSERAISADVADDLAAALGGADAVTRIGGTNRYATAGAVAERTVELLDALGRYEGKVLLATGESFPDAIAAGPLAARLSRPIVLTEPDALSDEASEALAAINAEDVRILGGTGAVSAAAAGQVAMVPGVTNVARLQGADRYLTSIAIAEYGVSEGLEWNGVAVAAGTNFPDALAGGVMQGRFNSVVLLSRPNALPTPVYDVLHAHRTEIGFCRILGGAAAVSEPVRVQIHNALQ